MTTNMHPVPPVGTHVRYTHTMKFASAATVVDSFPAEVVQVNDDNSFDLTPLDPDWMMVYGTFTIFPSELDDPNTTVVPID
jgi:hypothetical protein